MVDQLLKVETRSDLLMAILTLALYNLAVAALVSNGMAFFVNLYGKIRQPEAETRGGQRQSAELMMMMMVDL